MFFEYVVSICSEPAAPSLTPKGQDVSLTKQINSFTGLVRK
jgi:hypothetical protein